MNVEANGIVYWVVDAITGEGNYTYIAPEGVYTKQLEIINEESFDRSCIIKLTVDDKMSFRVHMRESRIETFQCFSKVEIEATGRWCLITRQ
jgi:hypothetical protein